MNENRIAKHGIPFGWHLPTQRMVESHHVANGLACQCVCVACGTGLVAKQGSIRTWHFAHGADTNCQHAAEAAIHRMAKQLIVERSQIFVPKREFSRGIHGKQRVWEETLSVVVQSGGLQTLQDCAAEKTIGTPRCEGQSRRPDVFGLLDGQPLAIEILNTHAVDHDKCDWLEEQKLSVLEIDVGDIAVLPPDQLLTALQDRLFAEAGHSLWLTHTKDLEAQRTLAQMEAATRRARFAEEQTLLAKIEAEEAERKRREEFRRRNRDVEDFKIRLGDATLRIGRNERRVSLKVYGYASPEVFARAKSVARRHEGWFNRDARCWDFQCQSGTKALFGQLCDELEGKCILRSLRDSSQGAPSARGLPAGSLRAETSLPIYFSDAAQQERFDERAGILEFDAGIERQLAEQIARKEVMVASSPAAVPRAPKGAER